jgi:hypothetical protein
MPLYEEYEAREMVVRKRLFRDLAPPFPLNAVFAVLELLWLLLKWVAHLVWAAVKWLRRFVGGERQLPSA